MSVEGSRVVITVEVPSGSRTCEGEGFRCGQLRTCGAPPRASCGAFGGRELEEDDGGLCVRLGCCLEAEVKESPSSSQSRTSWTYADGEENALVHAWYGRFNEDRELAKRSFGHLGSEYMVTTTVRVERVGERARGEPSLRSCGGCGADALTAILDSDDPESGLDRLGALVRDGWAYSLLEGKLLCPECSRRRGST